MNVVVTMHCDSSCSDFHGLACGVCQTLRDFACVNNDSMVEPIDIYYSWKAVSLSDNPMWSCEKNNSFTALGKNTSSLFLPGKYQHLLAKVKNSAQLMTIKRPGWWIFSVH